MICIYENNVTCGTSGVQRGGWWVYVYHMYGVSTSNRLSYDVPNLRWPTDVHNLGSRAFPGMAKGKGTASDTHALFA